ncbi:MAG: hypothetical protein DSY85_08580 [Marinomonas sp.]|nr:MAG: hypothetical protein DSY85_08580 [Marinomonas sp.]
MAVLREALLAREKRLEALVAERGQDECMYMEGPALVWELQSPIQEKLTIVPYMLSFPGIMMKRWHADERKWKELEQDAGLPLLSWAQTCPILAEVVSFLPEEVSSMASSVRYLQISMLNRCMTIPAFNQLCESDFNLAWLFLGCADQAQLSKEQIEQWLTRSRVDLLEWVTGHREKWVLKWLRNVQLSVGDVHEWRRLKNWASDLQQAVYLSGFKGANVAFLQAMILKDMAIDIRSWQNDLAELYNMSPLHRRQRLADIKALSEDIQRLGNALGIHATGHFLGVNSYQGLLKRHEKWMKRLNKVVPVQNDAQGVFPKPPLNGNERIEPIRTLYDLHHEGKLMQHCVASYREEVMAGKSYIYRYAGVQRATVELRCTDGVWGIAQVKGQNNEEATAETMSAIRAWFDQYEYSQYAYLTRRRALLAHPNDVFFPLPPIVTQPPFRAIETEQTFAQDQRFMNGHIMSTPAQIHAGERYVYFIDDPDVERVVEFERQSDGHWEMVNMVRRDGTHRQQDAHDLDALLAMSDTAFDWSMFE